MSTFFCKGFSRGTKCRECCAEKHLKYPPPQYQPPGPKIYRVATEYYSNTRVGKNCFDFHIFREKTIISCFRDHLFSVFLSFTKLFFERKKFPILRETVRKMFRLQPEFQYLPHFSLSATAGQTVCTNLAKIPPPLSSWQKLKHDGVHCTLYIVQSILAIQNFICLSHLWIYLPCFSSIYPWIFSLFTLTVMKCSPCFS